MMRRLWLAMAVCATLVAVVFAWSQSYVVATLFGGWALFVASLAARTKRLSFADEIRREATTGVHVQRGFTEWLVVHVHFEDDEGRPAPDGA